MYKSLTILLAVVLAPSLFFLLKLKDDNDNLHRESDILKRQITTMQEATLERQSIDAYQRKFNKYIRYIDKDSLSGNQRSNSNIFFSKKSNYKVVLFLSDVTCLPCQQRETERLNTFFEENNLDSDNYLILLSGINSKVSRSHSVLKNYQDKLLFTNQKTWSKLKFEVPVFFVLDENYNIVDSFFSSKVSGSWTDSFLDYVKTSYFSNN